MVKARPRIGFIGGGMIAQIGHLPFYLQNEACDVVCIAEERPSVRSALSRQLGADRVVGNRSDVLKREDVDAVVLSAPRAATGPLTLETLEARKHILVEKPMAHTVEQARRLVDAAEGLIYAIGYMKRNDPGVAAAKTLFDEISASGRLGQLLFARFYCYSKAYAVPPPLHVRPIESRPERYPVWPTTPDWLPLLWRSTYEWFLNSACHNINLISYFFSGDVELRDAQSRVDSSLTASLRCRGVPVALDIARTEAGRWLEGAEFLFERGRLSVEIPSPMSVNAVAAVRVDDLALGLRNEPMPTRNGWCFARQSYAFVQAIIGGDEMPTSGKAALADMQLIEAIWKHIAE